MSNPLKLFQTVLESFDNDSKWSDAPLGKIKTISNTKVGSVGQSFIEKFCNELKIPCKFPVNEHDKRLVQNPWDIEIYGIKFELKTATEDTNEHYQFNHVRYHRPYEALMCLGVSPDKLCFSVWSKADVVTGKAGNLVTMEKGANASYKLTKSADQLFPIEQFQKEIKKFANKFKK